MFRHRLWITSRRCQWKCHTDSLPLSRIVFSKFTSPPFSAWRKEGTHARCALFSPSFGWDVCTNLNWTLLIHIPSSTGPHHHCHHRRRHRHRPPVFAVCPSAPNPLDPCTLSLRLSLPSASTPVTIGQVFAANIARQRRKLSLIEK